MELRPYQRAALDSILNKYMEGVRHQLLVLATGTGKTVIFSHIFSLMKHLLPGKMLVFAHREELVDQAVSSIKRWNPDLKVGKEMAQFVADEDCDVIVSCVASIGREGSKRLSRFKGIDKVICDEAHHSIAQTYLNVFSSTGVHNPESKSLLVGFTATPRRKNLTRKEKLEAKTLDNEDIISLKSVYQELVYSYPIRQAIKEGYLVPLKGFRVKTETSLNDVKIVAGEFQQDQLQGAVNTPQRNAQIVKAWLEHGDQRQTIGFTAGVQHAKELAAAFVANGIVAEPIWGDDKERKEKLERFAKKDTTILLNAQLLTEGFDQWQVRCIILASPTPNSSKFTQEVGRGTRLQDGTGNLLEALQKGTSLEKTDCYIIDVVDNTKRCSLVTFPSLFGLNPDFDLNGEDANNAAEKIEELQDKYPGVNFTGLTDLKDVKAYVESIDMFAEPYTEEVKEFSQLTWMQTQDGSYTIAIPEKQEVKAMKQYYNFLHEKLHISLNELEEYELSITSVSSERKLGTFNTLQEAFETADDVLRRCRPDRLKLLSREADWHKKPASDAAKKMLRTKTKSKPFLYCLCPGNGAKDRKCATCGKVQGITAGQAATAINILKVKP